MMRNRWVIAGAALAVIVGVAWLAAASAVLLPVASVTLPHVPLSYSLTLWCDMLPYRNLSWRVGVPLGIGAAVPGLPLLGIAFLVLRRLSRRRPGPRLTLPPSGEPAPIIRGGSDNHGHAAWLSMSTALATLQPVPGHPALMIGEARRCHEPGPAPLLFDPCTAGPLHSLIFSGSDGFKTTTAISRLLLWSGNAIVLDPSREIGPMIQAARKAMGQEVVTLGLGGEGVDVLGAIDITAPNCNRRILSLVGSICGEEPERNENSVFSDAGRNLVSCLIAYILHDENLLPGTRTLAYFRELVTTPEDGMKKLLATIAGTTTSSLARFNASTLMGLFEETFSGAYFNAAQYTSWLFDDAAATLVSGGTFRAQDATAKPMTVFIQVPLDVLMTTPAVARVILDALVWAFIEADGAFHARTLMLVDEASKIGRMKALEIVRDTGRKYGLTLAMNWLSEAELREVWGKEGLGRWFATVSWRGYNAVTDRGTAGELSDEIDTFGALATSEGDNSGTSARGLLDLSTRSRGANQSTHEISRRLILKGEILTAPRDDMIVLRAGSAPMRLTVAPFFRRPELAGRVDANRFVRQPQESLTA